MCRVKLTVLPQAALSLQTTELSVKYRIFLRPRIFFSEFVRQVRSANMKLLLIMERVFWITQTGNKPQTRGKNMYDQKKTKINFRTY